MEILLTILLAALIATLLLIAKAMSNQMRMNKQRMEMKARKETADEQEEPTRQLVADTLRQMNCTPAMDGEIGIRFSYQGGNFIIDAADGYKFITIYYPFWYAFPLDDIELMAACQKAIGKANHKYSCTTLYNIYKENNTVALHTKRNILFVKEIPSLDHYLRSVMHDFFRSAHEVASEIDRVKELEETNHTP